MATTKRTTNKETKTIRATRTTSEKKVTPKRTTKKVEEDFDSLESPVENSPKKITFLPKLPKTVVLTLGGLIVLIGLVYLGAKYLVVAWVNNKPITRFEYYNELDKKNGPEVRDQLIRQRLVADEAIKRGIKVDKGEIDARAKQIEDQQGGAEQLNQRLQLSGLTKNDFNDLVKQQVTIEKMFGQGINITDDDVNKFITDNKDQMPATIDDKVKGQVREELKQQKINEAYSKWLNDAMQGKSVVKV